MTPSLPHDDDAALLSAGALTFEEMQAFEGHPLSAAQPSPNLRAWDRTVEQLASLVPACEPDPSIKQRLRERIAQERPTETSPVILRREDGWQPMGRPGLSYKLLFADHARQRMTIQLRAEPGARIPTHRHHGVEECLIVEGDLTDGEHTFSAGDYFRCEEGSRHHDQTTVHGCICLLVTALNPKLVSSGA